MFLNLYICLQLLLSFAKVFLQCKKFTNKSSPGPSCSQVGEHTMANHEIEDDAVSVASSRMQALEILKNNPDIGLVHSKRSLEMMVE